MKTVMRVFESLVKLNGWEVERFDLQRNSAKGIDDWYAGWLWIKGEDRKLVIREDGSFEWVDR